MRPTPVSAILLAAGLLQAQAAEAPYFRFQSGGVEGVAGGNAGGPGQSDNSQGGQPGAEAPSLAYQGWSGSPNVGNGPTGRYVATGLAQPVTYSAGPGLPPGITLQSDGSLTGQYAQAGTYTVPVTATGADGRTAASTYDVTVGSVPFAIGMPAVQPLVAGVQTSVTPVTVAGQPRSWRLVSGPAWASVDPATGTVTLSPAAASPATTLLLEATDASGNVAQAMTRAFAVADPSVDASHLAQAVREGVSSLGKALSNLPAPSWSLAAGPDWVSVASDGNVTVRTPDVSVATPYTMTLQATQGTLRATRDVTFDVLPASVTVGTVPSFLFGGGLVRADVETNIGSNPGISISGGPPWLSVGPDMILRGTAPNADATYQGVKVVASQDGVSAASAPFDMTVQAATATVTAPAKVRQGQPFTVALATNLANGAWSGTSSPDSATIVPSGSSATVTLPPGPAQSANRLGFTYANPSGYASASADVTSYPDLAVTFPLTGSASLAAGSGSSYQATVNNAIGTVGYELLASDGTSSPSALSACGMTFDPATGKLSATSLTTCSAANLAIRANDAGTDGVPGTAQSATSQKFSVSVSVPPANTVTPVAAFVGSGSVAVSAFWGNLASRRTGTPYDASFTPKVTLNNCDTQNVTAFMYDFGSTVSVKSISMDIYLTDIGSSDKMRLQYSNNKSTWTDAITMSMTASRSYNWYVQNASGGAVAARYFRLTNGPSYNISCGGFGGYVSQIRLAG